MGCIDRNISFSMPAASNLGKRGASRPRCAPRIPDRSTGTVDVYAQHAFPPKVSGRTTRPRCGLGRPARLAGNCNFFSRVTSSPHPALSIRSHGRCALEIYLWLVHYARFASGAWRPAQTAGTLITLRVSRVRPIQPTQHAHTICARSACAFLASSPRGS